NLAIEKLPVAIVGGGPSGLAAAATLAATLDGAVLVIERERETGGIPRHCDHLGFGIRDLRRFFSGPAYARRLTAAALDAGARLETEAQVTGWDGEHRLVVTSPRGRRIVEADAIVLATGARERPRPARLIAGDRPGGVYTTGELQNLVHMHHANVGRRAVVIGGELVSWSAVMTLREAGCSTAAMVTRYDRGESYAAFRFAGRLALRTPIVAHSRVVRINGKGRVESVVIEDLRTQEQHTIECDTVVTTGDWIPDHELARLAAIDIDGGTRGPAVDGGFRTSAAGVFAIGNLVHPVDTADIAALDGQHVAASIVSYIRGGAPQPGTVPITASSPFRWVSPQRIAPGGQTSRGDLLLWSEEFHRFPVVRARQDGKVIGEHRTLWPASPGRVFRSPSEIVANANPLGGPIAIELSAS
ncbi:MAG TPA: FAD-dependent oxidoreductase, partial [Ilumatobacteraceae bacterium]